MSPTVNMPEHELARLTSEAANAAAKGDLTLAENLYRRLANATPGAAEPVLALAGIRSAHGDFLGAVMLLEQFAALHPADFRVLHDLGAALQGAGQDHEALSAFTKAAAVAGSDIRAHLSAARLYRRLNNVAAAEKWLRRALALRPAATEAVIDLAFIKFDTHIFDEASQLFSRAAIALPSNADIGLQLAITHLNLGNDKEAEAELMRVSVLQPNDGRIPRVRLMLCKKRGDHRGVLANARAILRDAPDDPWAAGELAGAASGEADRREARGVLSAIVAKNRADARTWKQLADLAGGYERTIETLEDGIAATGDPALRLIRALTLPRIPVSHAQISAARREMDRHLEHLLRDNTRHHVDVIKNVSRVPYRLAYHGENDRVLQEKIAKAHLKLAPGLSWRPAGAARKQTHKRIRIGFFSAHLSWHSVGRMMAGLIRDLDRARFEVVVIRPPGNPDFFGEAINRSADLVVVAPQNLHAARAAIAGADLDILLYADIGMEPFTYYLAFSRLARKQIVWPGHPITTGLDTFDAFISGQSAEPENCDDHYTERLIKLTKVPIYDDVRVTTGNPEIRAELGLSDGTLYVCPMSLPKFHPDFDSLIRRILDKDPAGRLAVFDPGGTDIDVLTKRMAKSIPGLTERLVVLPYLGKQLFSDFLLAADANLDTPYFSGSGTSRDAASVGAPIVPLEGALMRGRLTAGMYIDMGMPDMVIRSEDAYVDLAVRLANDRTLRRTLGSEIKGACSTLVLNRGILREFQDCFTAVAEST